MDIYMPDMKYMDADQAGKYSSGASDYPELAKKVWGEHNKSFNDNVYSTCVCNMCKENLNIKETFERIWEQF